MNYIFVVYQKRIICIPVDFLLDSNNLFVILIRCFQGRQSCLAKHKLIQVSGIKNPPLLADFVSLCGFPFMVENSLPSLCFIGCPTWYNIQNEDDYYQSFVNDFNLSVTTIAIKNPNI